MYLERFAQRFKELSESKSVRQISRETNIPQKTLNNYVNGKYEIGIEYLCRIANYFNVDLDYLCGRKDY